ncbi:MAG: hypothetical protein JRJ84_00070 [Deltaproteobacteria bacterium]|nr:hypothetical protein [Deltaproteobacteria bacterium]
MSKLCALASLVALFLPGHLPAVDALGEAHAEALESWGHGDVHGAADAVRTTFAVPGVPTPPPDVARAYLVRAANYGTAPPLAHTAYPVDPLTTALLFDCALFLQADGDHRAAIHLLEMFLSHNPEHADAHLAVADSRLAVGDLQDARRHYRIYLDLLGNS